MARGLGQSGFMVMLVGGDTACLSASVCLFALFLFVFVLARQVDEYGICGVFFSLLVCVCILMYECIYVFFMYAYVYFNVCICLFACMRVCLLVYVVCTKPLSFPNKAHHPLRHLVICTVAIPLSIRA